MAVHSNIGTGTYTVKKTTSKTTRIIKPTPAPSSTPSWLRQTLQYGQQRAQDAQDTQDAQRRHQQIQEAQRRHQSSQQQQKTPPKQG